MLTYTLIMVYHAYFHSLLSYGLIYCTNFSYSTNILWLQNKVLTIIIGWLIDLYWVRALTVPMHLDLTDRPFVPHNLISAQESTVPLPKFQMAPRFKILMSSGSKKGTKIYYPFVPRSPSKRITSRFPSGVPMEWDTRLQGIFASLLIYLFISKALRKERPSMLPKSGAPMETDAHYRVIIYLLGSLVKKPPSRSPSWIPLGERCPFPRPLHSSFKVPSIRAPPPDSCFPSDVKGPLWREMPYPEPFLTYLPGFPVKEPFPEVLRTELLQKETLHS